MSTVLKIKRSITEGNIPVSLSLGELAVNIPDKKIWIGDSTQTPILISEYGVGGAGGQTYYEGLGINIDTNNNISVDVGQGISVDTNNGVNLDLSTIPRIDTSIGKSDYLPFLDVSTGTTDLVTVQNFIRSTLFLNVTTAAYDGVSNDEFLGISLQDNNPNAFRISTLQGGKSSIFKIDTEGVSAITTIAGTAVSIEPSSELNIGSISVPTNVFSSTITLSNATDINFTYGDVSVTGIKNIVADVGGTVYVTGNLIVSGYIETDTGLRGNTNDENEYLGIGMTLDGGEY